MDHNRTSSTNTWMRLNGINHTIDKRLWMLASSLRWPNRTEQQCKDRLDGRNWKNQITIHNQWPRYYCPAKVDGWKKGCLILLTSNSRNTNICCIFANVQFGWYTIIFPLSVWLYIWKMRGSGYSIKQYSKLIDQNLLHHQKCVLKLICWILQ